MGFYENCPVLQADEPTRASRLALCSLTARTIHKGLELLGIETLEEINEEIRDPEMSSIYKGESEVDTLLTLAELVDTVIMRQGDRSVIERFAFATTPGLTLTSPAPLERDKVETLAIERAKTFAAGLSGVLVAEGEFGWDDRVIDYIPDFRVDGDASLVRVENLLGQSTGLIPHAYDNLIEDGLPMDRIKKQFSNLPYLCEPGECYSYQNSVFSLIEPVIEKTNESIVVSTTSAPNTSAIRSDSRRSCDRALATTFTIASSRSTTFCVAMPA